MTHLDDLTLPPAPRAARPGRESKRRIGFPGERAVVLPPGQVEAARGAALTAPLIPCAAGYFPGAAGHEVLRPQGLRETVLVLCTAGQGWARLGALEGPVGAGELLILPPEVPHAYGASEDAPWSVSWMHLEGSEVPGWCALLGWTPETPVVRVSHSSHRGDLPDFSRVCAALEPRAGGPGLLVASCEARLALALLVRAQAEVAPPDPLTAVARWMEAHLHQRLRLAELAERAGLSPSQFGVVFRRRFGHSPLAYLTRLRVQRACVLLDETDLSVAEVAFRVGVGDPLYFSRLFRQAMGCSPRRFRART